MRYRGELCDDYKSLALILLDLGEDVAAAAAAEGLSRIRPDNPRDKLDAARYLASCVLIVRRGSLPEAIRAGREQEYARKALDLLREAFGPGSGLAPRSLDQDRRFDPLRERNDFQEFRDELDKRAKPAVGRVGGVLGAEVVS